MSSRHEDKRDTTVPDFASENPQVNLILLIAIKRNQRPIQVRGKDGFARSG